MSVEFIQLSNYVKPTVIEERSKDWVLNGKNNNYFEYVNNRYIGSPTNSAIINGYCSMIYGKGLAIENSKNNLEQSLAVKKLLKKKDTKRIVKDFETQGMAYFQVQYNKIHEIISISHIAVNKLAPNKKNEDNEIEGFWYCEDFSNTRKFTPEFIPAFGTSKEGLEVYCLKPYSLTTEYFSLPTYQSGLPFAQLEEEIGNYSLNHIKNGLSAGYIINFPNSSSYTNEQKEEIKRKIKIQLTGSNNAAAFVLSFNEGNDSGVTIELIQQNVAHKQWESLTEQAQDKILVSHEVVSSALFGVKDANGFSSAADELFEAHRQTMMRIIKPKQEYITDAIEEMLSQDGIFVDLYFIDLQEPKEIVVEEKTELKEHICLGNHAPIGVADELIALGEDFNESEWLVLSENEVDYATDDHAHDLISLASTGTAIPNAKSEQDSKDIVIRYKYVGNKNPQREFCQKMVTANKVYRKEDIIRMGSRPVNAGMGIKGADTYDIWLYKGSVQCKHKWNRVIYLKKNGNVDVNSPLAQKISTSEARRKGYKVPKNDSLVSIAPNKMPNGGAYPK